MWTVLPRFALILLAAAAGVGLFLYSNFFLKSYFHGNLQIRNRLQSLQTDLYALKGEILQNGSFLYYSYDNIHHLDREIEKLLETLKASPHLKTAVHNKSRQAIFRISTAFEKYMKEIEHYLTLNASLKNSAIYIPTLQLRAFSVFDTADSRDRETLLLLSRINASIFLARNAQDLDFLSDIRNHTRRLEKLLTGYEGSKKRLLLTLKEHLEQFTSGFPTYILYLDRLLHNDLIMDSSRLIRTFQKEAAEELGTINRTSQWLLFLYLFSLAVVTYYILRTYRENRYLKKLKSELERSLHTDSLTGLGNRLAYREAEEKMKAPVLILINIDRFKHINEFYGTNIGDGVLIALAQRLRKITPEPLRAGLFRVGGDDFGVLFEKENSPMELPTLLNVYHENLENSRFSIEELTIDLSFALGASDRKNWLFETADMALKSAKHSLRKRYALYTPEMDKREEIARNIQALRSIRTAIDSDSLLPYFQPICDRESGRITKFEALARIELDQGKYILQPYSFIHTATEAKLSGEITLKILKRTLRMAEKHPFDFSVNLSAADISDKEDRERIIRLLTEHRHLADRIIFEMLESEEIRDYDSTAEFIALVKRYGCRIAVDDFGSGYSNFEKILKLDIDILKIDGSLIRRIDHDRHSELIVRTILDFARHAGWKTVAEFVHSKSVYEKVSSMGFDYLQGYYIGKPARELQPNLFQPTDS